MEIEFFFNHQSVGILSAKPREGTVNYMPFRGFGHYEMVTQITQTGKPVRCCCEYNGTKYTFLADQAGMYKLTLSCIQELP